MKAWITGIIRVLLVLIGLAAGLGLISAIAYLLSDRTNGSIVSSGKKRSYLLHVPKTYNSATLTPLVISIHGYGEWPAHQMQISHWNDLADRYGFIVIYPAGTGLPKRWRTRGAPGSDADPMLDVTFISELIDKLESEYNIDTTRIYANGLSNGGGMSFVLSCLLSERIAAIGTVSGAYLFPWSECRFSRPVPTIVFHGTADPIVPYQGGPSKAFDLPFPAIPAWVDALARHNGCTGAPVKLAAKGDVSGVHFTGRTSKADVIFYTIAGGGHSWPGGKPIPEFIVGHTTQDIDATQIMWDFFQQHPLQEE